MKFADLHIHSHFSDSSLSCEDIFKRAYSEGISCISISDHDTLDAYTKEELPAYSNKYSVEVIKGIEFSSQHGDKEIHLLGYFAGGAVSQDFLPVLDKLKQDRLKRILKMAEKLVSLGIKIDIDEFKSFVGAASLSRLHLAIFLKAKNIVAGIPEAFSKYVGVGKPAYISRFRYDLAQGIGILKKAGALVFLAHPLNIFSLEEIKGLLALGLDGIEAFYPFYSQAVTNDFITLSRQLGFLITGGSDAHGKYKRQHIGTIKMPYEYAEKIKDAGR
jgi:predicted metal-dependent phosphoesterase TrpH